MKLRDYQANSISMLYEWMLNNKGHPCLELPTGAGKSIVIAALIKDALQRWPRTRIVMATHSKELIEQNAAKMKTLWPQCPMGIYSASVGQKRIDQVTFCGIQSVRNKANQFGKVDLLLVDEAHAISHKAQGGYRKFIDDLLAVNPRLRVIGLTATPYRLGHGLITDAPALFTEILAPTNITELVDRGYLSPLRSKQTEHEISTEGLKVRGGDFIEGDLQRHINTAINNEAAVHEIIARADGRRHWLIFCAGVEHSDAVARMFEQWGVKAVSLTGQHTKNERESIIEKFKSGTITALTNCNILTTGFDFPDIDLIAFLRPTLSPGLYSQMAGRGLRLKSHTDHCLVLDFANLVGTHGPVTNIKPPVKGKRAGDAPIKLCDECGEKLHISVRVCPECNFVFPEPEKEENKYKLNTQQDIMGEEITFSLYVRRWSWRVHTSKKSGNDCLRCTYYGDLSDKPINEYFSPNSGGRGDAISYARLAQMAIDSGADDIAEKHELRRWCELFNNATPPAIIYYEKRGIYEHVTKREWETDSDHRMAF